MAARTCSVDGCENASRDLGLCIKHATRLRRTGSTDARTTTVQERFLAKVDRSGDCWVWQALVNRAGYGRFWFDGKSRPAHRVAHVLFVGPIPEGYDVDHLCHNPACVRPEHLEAVTPAENTRRRRAFVTANAAKTHCPQGHPYDEANTYQRPGRKHRECRTCREDRQEANAQRASVA